MPQEQKGGCSSSLEFRPGMKLEAKDRKNPGLTCVATISEIRDGQLLIHFDGWSTSYDYWCEPSSTDIHPVGWCLANGKELQPPYGRVTFLLSHCTVSGRLADPILASITKQLYTGQSLGTNSV